ncbi:uncharacterized protein K452DRAFT_352095 [Aplosporella prunicola CBS 121167]|uniref:Conserved oligomeric Golgi complex subunit 2 n=1 Tax=Aplosporella prunicola CBS 121167 TaxID=1176127 RepID=A0A6A6BAR0_9PEZI|nr:uncharacterized protein K452DRAFT_352095 [Aplosporella prunicola CBS 121167]KAF2140355.1 hypothetical protein K452DRAFT_352095 [Aplosporella prunicola CBS 121167]
MSQFYLPSSQTPSSSASAASASAPASDDDDTTLPYPHPLPRSDFAAPPAAFSASTYLSSLSHRHQTLADLRADLRARSQQITRELLDLVNANYADFLSLGQALQGGEERVEEVRVGLLGLRGAVGDVRGVVGGRESELSELLEEREEVRRLRGLGGALLEVERRVGELEAGLLLVGQLQGQNLQQQNQQQKQRQGKNAGTNSADDSDDDLDDNSSASDSDDDDDDDDALLSGSVPLTRLRRLVQQYLGVKQLTARIGPAHPFLVAQEPRILKVRNTLLLDLGVALKQARAAGVPGRERVLRLMQAYADMDESAEAVKVLREVGGGKRK